MESKHIVKPSGKVKVIRVKDYITNLYDTSSGETTSKRKPCDKEMNWSKTKNKESSPKSRKDLRNSVDYNICDEEADKKDKRLMDDLYNDMIR